jgi:hypothetical protein
MNSGTPSVRSTIGNLFRQRLTAGHVRDHLGAQARRQAIESDEGHMRATDPGRRKLRPEGKYHQCPQRGHSIDEEVERLARGRIAPVHVLPHHQHRLPRGKSLDLRQLGMKHPFLALLRRQVKGRIAVPRGDRQQFRQQRNGLTEIIGSLGQDSFQLREPLLRWILAPEPAARSSWAIG